MLEIQQGKDEEEEEEEEGSTTQHKVDTKLRIVDCFGTAVNGHIP